MIPDGRDPDRVIHLLPDILRARIFAIACGYEDADDLDRLAVRSRVQAGVWPLAGYRPGFVLAADRLAVGERAGLARPRPPDGRVMVDLYCASYTTPPQAVTLDIDDTFDAVHGHQQLSLFNAHYDERCFLPIHIYEATRGQPVAMMLREGKTPSGREVRSHLVV